jgi:hypothetical protein
MGRILSRGRGYRTRTDGCSLLLMTVDPVRTHRYIVTTVRISRTATHNVIWKVDLRLATGAAPDRVALNETAIRVTVGGTGCTPPSIRGTNYVYRVRLFQTRTTPLDGPFLFEFRTRQRIKAGNSVESVLVGETSHTFVLEYVWLRRDYDRGNTAPSLRCLERLVYVNTAGQQTRVIVRSSSVPYREMSILTESGCLVQYLMPITKSVFSRYQVPKTDRRNVSRPSTVSR